MTKPNKRKQRRRNSGTCTYCQQREAETRDHVVPRALFTPPLPINLVTVPACAACNRRKGEDDDYLRDYLAMDFAGSESPIADTLLRGKISRSVARNQSELFREIAPRIKPQPFYTKGGIYLGAYLQAPIDDARIARGLGRIARGLFNHFSSGQLVPPDYEVEVWRIMPWDMEEAWKTFSRFHLNRCAPIGDVWAGTCARVKEEPLSSLWMMSFYSRVHFVVSVMHPNLGELASRARRVG